MSKTMAHDHYARILAEISDSTTPTLPATGERRGAPRVSVTSGDMTVNLNVAVSPVDISISGACFFAERAFAPGTRIEMSVASVFTVSAVVVDCMMEESGSEFMEVHYRVRCKFVDEGAGMELLVLTKDRENLM
jgi:hypothetical protein